MWLLLNAPELEASQFWVRESLGELVAGLWREAPGLWFPLHEIKGTKPDSGLSLAVCLWKTKQNVMFLMPVESPITILITVYGNSIAIENSIGHFWVLNSQSMHSSSISWGGAAARIILVWRHWNQLCLRVVVAYLSRPKQILPKILPNIFGWFEWLMVPGAPCNSELTKSHHNVPTARWRSAEKLFWKEHGKQEGFIKLRI